MNLQDKNQKIKAGKTNVNINRETCGVASATICTKILDLFRVLCSTKEKKNTNIA